jgi:hypothetical protein
MNRPTLAILLGLLTLSCTPRTFIRPTSDDEAQGQAARVGYNCNVRDFASATDIPAGARPLGPVEVEPQASDDETFIALRQRICELGGDALSQPAWVKDPSEEKPRLTANAWSLP